MSPPSATDAGFAVLDAMIGAAFAALFSVAILGGLSHVSQVAHRMEQKSAAWAWTQAILEDYPTADAAIVQEGETPTGRFHWRVELVIDENDPSMEIIRVDLSSKDRAARTHLSTRRLRRLHAT
jgi:hypothetical protein